MLEEELEASRVYRDLMYRLDAPASAARAPRAAAAVPAADAIGGEDPAGEPTAPPEVPAQEPEAPVREPEAPAWPEAEGGAGAEGVEDADHCVASWEQVAVFHHLSGRLHLAPLDAGQLPGSMGSCLGIGARFYDVLVVLDTPEAQGMVLSFGLCAPPSCAHEVLREYLAPSYVQEQLGSGTKGELKITGVRLNQLDGEYSLPSELELGTLWILAALVLIPFALGTLLEEAGRLCRRKPPAAASLFGARSALAELLAPPGGGGGGSGSSQPALDLGGLDLLRAVATSGNVLVHGFSPALSHSLVHCAIFRSLAHAETFYILAGALSGALAAADPGGAAQGSGGPAPAWARYGARLGRKVGRELPVLVVVRMFDQAVARVWWYGAWMEAGQDPRGQGGLMGYLPEAAAAGALPFGVPAGAALAFGGQADRPFLGDLLLLSLTSLLGLVETWLGAAAAGAGLAAAAVAAAVGCGAGACQGDHGYDSSLLCAHLPIGLAAYMAVRLAAVAASRLLRSGAAAAASRSQLPCALLTLAATQWLAWGLCQWKDRYIYIYI